MDMGAVRAWVDNQSTERTAIGRIREVADAHGWEYRRLHSWYYGERGVPPHIAAVLPATSPLALKKAFLRVIKELDRTDALVRAVSRMCQDCEQGGECHIPDCPLRAVSPMPLRLRKA